ncbi:MAG: hypothetical protein WCG95_08260 [bacterium]
MPKIILMGKDIFLKMSNNATDTKLQSKPDFNLEGLGLPTQQHEIDYALIAILY